MLVNRTDAFRVPHVAVRDALVQKRGHQALGGVAHNNEPITSQRFGTATSGGGQRAGDVKRNHNRHHHHAKVDERIKISKKIAWSKP